MRQVIYMALLIIIILGACNFHDQVDNDYFISVERVKGKNKPSMPEKPVISSCEQSISVTLFEAIDQDGDSLSYIIYASSEDPSLFASTIYYDQSLIVGIVFDISESVSFFSTAVDDFFFWYTAYDGGRESDHSEVVSVSVPGPLCP